MDVNRFIRSHCTHKSMNGLWGCTHSVIYAESEHSIQGVHRETGTPFRVLSVCTQVSLVQCNYWWTQHPHTLKEGRRWLKRDALEVLVRIPTLRLRETPATLLMLNATQFCTQLMKTHVAETFWNQVVSDSSTYVSICLRSNCLCTLLWRKKLKMASTLRICNSLWQKQGGEQTDSPLKKDKEKCWSTVILHVNQPSPHSRGMGWHSHDVQTWHKSTSHSLSPPSLLDPWGRALRGGSSELDWGRMEWVDVSGLMRSKCTQRGNCNLQLHSHVLALYCK